jgi:citronellol/citronellal dehydrogenase
MKQNQYQSVFKAQTFQGKAILVTGAGSGIGRCCAHELAALGAQVGLLGRKTELLEKTAQEIFDATGQRPWMHSADIRNEEAVKGAVKSFIDHFARLDGVVNNAGGQFPAPMESLSLNGWEAVLKTNLTGGFLVAREAVLQWMGKNGGAMVNIIADMWNGMPGMGHSGAARAGMLNFTETAACEWARFGIRVNAVAPGWIASSGFDKYDPTSQKPQLKRLKKIVPLQRFGTESEVSAAIVFLLSDAANFVTGSCIRVDGGVPNARHTWPTQTSQRTPSTAPFDGFHLHAEPKVMQNLDD